MDTGSAPESRIFWILKGVGKWLGAALALIGLGGLQDDIKQWRKWGDEVPSLDLEEWSLERVLLIFFGIGFFICIQWWSHIRGLVVKLSRPISDWLGKLSKLYKKLPGHSVTETGPQDLQVVKNAKEFAVEKNESPNSRVTLEPGRPVVHDLDGMRVETMASKDGRAFVDVTTKEGENWHAEINGASGDVKSGIIENKRYTVHPPPIRYLLGTKSAEDGSSVIFEYKWGLTILIGDFGPTGALELKLQGSEYDDKTFREFKKIGGDTAESTIEHEQGIIRVYYKHNPEHINPSPPAPDTPTDQSP